MYSIHEKLIELCPVIKDLLIDEGIFRTGGSGAGPKTELMEQQNLVMNEMLARLVNLQQFVQGGHGSKSRQYQPNESTLGGYGVGETSLYEEMRMIKAT
jgi:hypothetical protein